MPHIYNCDLHGILNCNVCPCTYPRLLYTCTVIYLASLFVMSVPVHTPNIQHTYYIHANAISTCNVCPCTYPKYITYIHAKAISNCNVCPCTNPILWTVTDLLMEVWNFISALTECTGDRHFNCITRLRKGFETLTL